MNIAITFRHLDSSTAIKDYAHDKIGKLQVQAQGWAHQLNRKSRFFQDPELLNQQQIEDLKATRIGGTLANLPPASVYRIRRRTARTTATVWTGNHDAVSQPPPSARTSPTVA